MSRIFVDTSAILALLNPDDAHHAAAREAFARLEAGDAILVTTSLVLVEVYSLLTRRMGLKAVQSFRSGFSPLFDVVWVDQTLHEAGLDLLLAKRSRDLSLVDAVSFLVMQERNLETAFACDRHFRLDGFSTIP